MKRIKIPIDKAIGEKIPHDFTKIAPKEGFKGVAFKKGHVITKEDIPLLRQIGKNYIYKIELDDNEIHEDDFAISIAPHLAGKNIVFDDKPQEGKITFRSSIDGLFKLDKKRIIKLNLIEQTSFPTIHDNFPVSKNQQVAAFRIIPLATKKSILERAIKIAEKPLIWVEEYKIKKAALISTGNELYDGLVEDLFKPEMQQKLKKFGVEVVEHRIVKDDIVMIKDTFFEVVKKSEIVFISGGSSVDPDDVTKYALKRAGVKFIREGNPIQPANNLSIGYFGEKTVCVVPAGALFYKASALDIFLPRLIAKDKITKKEIASYAIGGLCHFCKVCVYPVCPFGKV